MQANGSIFIFFYSQRGRNFLKAASGKTERFNPRLNTVESPEGLFPVCAGVYAAAARFNTTLGCPEYLEFFSAAYK